MSAQRPTYYELLKDPRWQKKRLEIFQRDDWQCRWCFTGEVTLNVHHTYYQRGAAPWEYPDHALLTLCESCHAKITDRRRVLDQLIARITTVPFGADYLEQLIGYAAAFASHVATSDVIRVRSQDEGVGIADYFGIDPELLGDRTAIDDVEAYRLRLRARGDMG